MSMQTEIDDVRLPAAEIAIRQPVLREILRQLQASPYAAIKELCCDYHEGVAILRGSVPTFYTRQVAQAIVRKVEGVEQLDDHITVDNMPRR